MAGKPSTEAWPDSGRGPALHSRGGSDGYGRLARTWPVVTSICTNVISSGQPFTTVPCNVSANPRLGLTTRSESITLYRNSPVPSTNDNPFRPMTPTLPAGPRRTFVGILNSPGPSPELPIDCPVPPRSTQYTWVSYESMTHAAPSALRTMLAFRLRGADAESIRKAMSSSAGDGPTRSQAPRSPTHEPNVSSLRTTAN